MLRGCNIRYIDSYYYLHNKYPHYRDHRLELHLMVHIGRRPTVGGRKEALGGGGWMIGWEASLENLDYRESKICCRLDFSRVFLFGFDSPRIATRGILCRLPGAPCSFSLLKY